MYGVKAIPASWLEPLELREVITEVAEDLFTHQDWVEQGWIKKEIWEKYPGW
jgi:hypothetical protein